VLVTTRRRVEAIGMEIPPHIAGGMGQTNKPITPELPEGVPVDIILAPHENEEAGRHVALRSLSRPVVSHAPRVAETAIELAKISRLLPAVVLGPLSRDPGNKRRDWAREQDLIYVDVAETWQQKLDALRLHKQLSERQGVTHLDSIEHLIEREETNMKFRGFQVERDYCEAFQVAINYRVRWAHDLLPIATLPPIEE